MSPTGLGSFATACLCSIVITSSQSGCSFRRVQREPRLRRDSTANLLAHRLFVLLGNGTVLARVLARFSAARLRCPQSDAVWNRRLSPQKHCLCPLRIGEERRGIHI